MFYPLLNALMYWYMLVLHIVCLVKKLIHKLLPPPSQAKAMEESSQYEFENYMRQQLLLAEEKNTIHETKSFLTKRQFGSIPPVRRLGHDAQPVSPLDAAILAQRFLRK